MKTIFVKRISVAASVMLAFVAFTAFRPSASRQNLTLRSATASIRGSSTLHDWESTIGKLSFKGSMQSSGAAPSSISNVVLVIPVRSIKSKEGKVMDDKTFEAFKSDQNPTITYKCANAVVKSGGANSLVVVGAGNLSMAGATRPASVTTHIKMLKNGDMEMTGSYTFKMTQFGMKPPTAVLGTIKVGDQVTMVFDLVLKQSAQ